MIPFFSLGAGFQDRLLFQDYVQVMEVPDTPRFWILNTFCFALDLMLLVGLGALNQGGGLEAPVFPGLPQGVCDEGMSLQFSPQPRMQAPKSRESRGMLPWVTD